MRKPFLPAAALIAFLISACREQPAEPGQETAPTAATAPASAPAPQPAMIEVSYECVPVVQVSAKYDNSVDPPRAIVTVDGKDYEMTLAPSGSGARYVTLTGRSPGMTLVWWNKGSDGFLQEGRGETSDDEKNIATCVEKSS